MRNRTEHAVGIREALGQYLRRAGLKRRLDQAGAVEEWAEIVGPQVANVTRAEGVSADGVLWVRVASPAWMQELQLQSPEILRRLGARGRKIRRIMWRLGTTQ